jgi:hypothetical protein
VVLSFVLLCEFSDYVADSVDVAVAVDVDVGVSV